MIADFYSNAEGDPPEITWQWQGSPTGDLWETLADGQHYSGAQTPHLQVIFSDATLDGWWYRAVASNGFLTATSGSAQLTITNGTGSE